MIGTVLQENMLAGLQTVGRAVSGRSTLPITQNVLVRTEDGMLRMTATNLRFSITTWIPGMFEQEGETTIPHREFQETVRAMPSEPVRLDLAETGAGQLAAGEPAPGSPDLEQWLRVACGSSRSRIACAPADLFPPIPGTDEEASALIAPDVLSQGIAMVLPSAASDESRPVLTGIRMLIAGSRLTMATSDGYRLSVYETELDRPAQRDVGVIVPADAMSEVRRLCAGQSEPVALAVSESSNQLLFKTASAELVAQMLQGEFPEYRNLIPDEWETMVEMDLAAINRAVQSAAVFARDGSSNVRMEISGPAEGGAEGGAGAYRMAVSGQSDSVGDSRSVLALPRGEGKSNRIAFNIRFLQDLLNVLPVERVVMEMSGGSSRPCVFHGGNRDEFLHVIMPVQVSWQ